MLSFEYCTLKFWSPSGRSGAVALVSASQCQRPKDTMLRSQCLLLLSIAVVSGARTVRSKWIEVTIGFKDCNVQDYGAIGDGKHGDTGER